MHSDLIARLCTYVSHYTRGTKREKTELSERKSSRARERKREHVQRQSPHSIVAQIMLTKKISQSLSLIVLNPFNDGSGNTIRKFSRDVKEIHAQCFPEEHRFATREEGSRRRQKRDGDERDYRGEEVDDDQFFDRLCALHEESDQLWILLVKEEPKKKNKKTFRIFVIVAAFAAAAAAAALTAAFDVPTAADDVAFPKPPPVTAVNATSVANKTNPIIHASVAIEKIYFPMSSIETGP